jgi:hypothetical protein
MQVEQKRWTEAAGWETQGEGSLKDVAQLVLVFGGVDRAAKQGLYPEIKAMYPAAHILIGSTAGEIMDVGMTEDSVVLSALAFAKTTLAFATADIAQASDSQAVGQALGKQLEAKGLVHVMVFSDGLKVNGTALVAGLRESLPENLSITGGLVGGGNEFKHTYVGLDAVPTEGKVILVGFYGSGLVVGYGSLGGWDTFGPDRTITKSKDNVLFELDGKPALELYKEYLGDKAKDLPASGLLFPLNLNINGDDVVRTLLAIDEKAQSMTFAGDMPEGVSAKLMHANFERLIDGAGKAAELSSESIGSGRAEFAILVSCIGRKLVLRERIDEELEAVRGVLGPLAAMAGFYSYGEICPTAASDHQCRLHNQTMTITTFREEV